MGRIEVARYKSPQRAWDLVGRGERERPRMAGCSEVVPSKVKCSLLERGRKGGGSSDP